ncbi:TlpA disulfide reductase family protein [Polynucleobacter sp. MWH-UH2A]|uniref:TlpA family protein disulfide reductase n=1 Tax=Polynucleobacter sp. MWH-UH2A TaxID=1855617 RepID=UPI001BFDB0BC|nr:TlpA disulfide reductase family protein [Polynucleobacter sp. MWH-UH2A]QWD63451.1 TlpA family protein disulfide reductase [Polynucleobacter sp. MWH-UH2A]
MRLTKPVLEIALALAFVFLSFLTTSANAQWQPASKVGLTQAPPLQLNNLAGKSVDIAHFKGKVLLVNFWASWCEPCRAEFEELIELQESYGNKGLTVLAVNLAEMKPRITQFLKGNGLPENGIEILLDRNSTAYKSWKARGIPTTFLVNKTGKLEAVWIGAIENADSAEVKGKIEALLRQ